MPSEVRSAVIFLAVWIIGMYAWEAVRARVLPQIPPLGDVS